VNPITLALRAALEATALLAPPLVGRAAYGLFGRPFVRAKVGGDHERTVMARARVSTLDVDGRGVRVYAWGAGSPVLLVHGFRSRASHFAALVPALEERGHTVVAFDAPGHGDSPGRGTTLPEYVRIIRGLWAEYGDFAAVVAHSFGVICTFNALRDGVRAGKVVAVSGVSEFTFVRDEFVRQLGVSRRVGEALSRRVEELFPGIDPVWRRFSAGYRPERVTVPLLVIHDEQDGMVGHDQAVLLTEAYRSQAELITTQGLGHRRILGAPGTTEAVLHFLAVPRLLSTDA